MQDLQTTAASFWRKPEGKAGAILALGLMYLGVKTAMWIVPILVSLAVTTTAQLAS